MPWAGAGGASGAMAVYGSVSGCSAGIATSGVGLPSGQRMSFLVLGYLVPLLSACCDLHLHLLPWAGTTRARPWLPLSHIHASCAPTRASRTLTQPAVEGCGEPPLFFGLSRVQTWGAYADRESLHAIVEMWKWQQLMTGTFGGGATSSFQMLGSGSTINMLGSSGGCQSLPLVQPGLHQDLAVQPGAMMAMHPMTALMAMQICILSWWSWNRWWSCSWCWWGRWRCWCSRTDVDSSTLHVLCLQHLRAAALDVATLADFSQGHNRDLSVEVEAFPFQLALEPRNAKSLTLDPGNSPAIVPTGCVTRGTHKELTVISVRLPDILRSLQSSIAWKAAKWSCGRANMSQDFQGSFYHPFIILLSSNAGSESWQPTLST